MKNPTPRKIILISASITSLGSGVLLLSLSLTSAFYIPWYYLVGVVIINFLVTVLVFHNTIQRFIYRKIKLIYKAIYDLKSPRGQGGRVPLNQDIISDVESEVLRWAKTKKQEMEQLKKLEQYRREFLGNVSHELRTPLFSIQGYLDTLLDGGVHDPEINTDYLQRAANNADRLNSIVKDLETISMSESGEMELNFQVFNIMDLVNEVIQSLQVQADNKNIHLGLKEGCSTNFKVYADQEKIRQVLANLVFNSIKYGKESGRTLISSYDMDENILVEVSDDGIGIDQEHLPRLFERFYRIDKNRSRKEGGTGLGLSIVKHIIEAHNQTVHVRSTVGIGSTFGFTLKKA